MPCPAAAWGAIASATRCERPRVPFLVDDIEVGSVATEYLPALLGLNPVLQVDPARVRLTAAAARRDDVLADINATLRQQGLIRAWRDETYPVVDPRSLQVLAHFERAASRFWGTLSFGAHCTGWVAGGDGWPTWLWIAQRSFDKATDPGAFDNLVGGGVPHGQTPFETLVREGWEEAGLPVDVMRRATPGRVIRLQRDTAEGLQFEWIHGFDLALQPHEVPVNRDGEVHAFTLHPAAQALGLAAGTTMTTDSALVTLDFALRHHLLAAADQAALKADMAALWVHQPSGRA